MKPDDLKALIHVAARIGGDYQGHADLYPKVRAIVGWSASLRLIAAATIFHVWLLTGRPDRRRWSYRNRVRWALQALTQYTEGLAALGEPIETDLTATRPN